MVCFLSIYLTASINSEYRTPRPLKSGKPIAVPMLWGGGTADSTDASRLAQFKKITNAPDYVLGYEEPDCRGSGSAGLSVAAGVSHWEALIVPLGKKGSLLGSPSMCSSFFYVWQFQTFDNFIAEQADETWLSQFRSKISTGWDFTAVHINKNNLDGVKKDIVRDLHPSIPRKHRLISPRTIIGILIKGQSG